MLLLVLYFVSTTSSAFILLIVRPQHPEMSPFYAVLLLRVETVAPHHFGHHTNQPGWAEVYNNTQSEDKQESITLT